MNDATSDRDADERDPSAGHDTVLSPDAGRWAPLLGGSLLALASLRVRGLSGVVLALAGGTLLYRGAIGRWPAENLLGAGRVRGTELRMAEAVTIGRPVDEVYRFWRRLENLPRFMHHLQSVEELSDGRWRWRVRVPETELTVEWESLITEERENESLAWRSLPGAALYNEGTVRFAAAPGGHGTQLQATILYRPPGGSIGAAVARLIRALPAQLVREDLRRLKQVLEAGETPGVPGQVSGA